MEATMTSKGQVTIPKTVRDLLQLRTGDRVDFIVESDGTVVMVPLTRSIKSLKGMLPKPGKTVTLDEMDKAIVRGATDK
jgi:AbrB family looped-hinge helix DNA binding protein